jgi:hypothetical protein
VDVQRAKPIATLDLARDVLTRIPVQDMLPMFELSDVFSSTLPVSGMWAGGQVFELPTPVHHTDGSGSSSLPTPTARDSAASGGSTPSDVTLTDAVVRTELGTRENPRHLPTPRATRGASSTETMYALGAERSDEHRTQWQVLMPTPRTSDTNGPGSHGTGGPDLRTVVSLLPTPLTTTADGVQELERRVGGRGSTLADEVEHLLPTPVAAEGVKATTRQGSAQKSKTGQVWLTNVAHDLAVLNGESTDPLSDGGNES